MKRNKLDIVFSYLVRERAGWNCERCGKHYPPGHRRGLECSHVFGRRRQSVRYHPLNAMALCTGCHRHVTAHPQQHMELYEKKFGAVRMEALRRLANTTVKRTAFEKEKLHAEMKAELRRLESLRNGGEVGRLEFME